MRVMRAFAPFACLLCVSSLSLAGEVYRWVDANGTVHYGDRAPDSKARPAQLPELQVIPGTPKPAPAESTAAAPGASTDAAPPAAATAKPSLSVITPQPEQVLRDTSRELAVRVRIDSPLPEGAGLIYYLDGASQTPKPINATSFTLKNVDRGSHLVDVGVVDAGGKLLVRTPPIIVHVQPPGLK